MAIDSSDVLSQTCLHMWVCNQYSVPVCVLLVVFEPRLVFSFHLHMWESEVKVAEAKQTALLLVAGAAALRPGRLGPSPAPAAGLLRSVIHALTPGAPHPAHTTVLIRLIGLDLELPPVPVVPAPVTCGPC